MSYRSYVTVNGYCTVSRLKTQDTLRRRAAAMGDNEPFNSSMYVQEEFTLLPRRGARRRTCGGAHRAEKNYFIQKPPEIAQVPDFGENGPNPFL